MALRTVALLLVLGPFVLIAACGGGDGDDSNGATTGESPVPTATSAAGGEEPTASGVGDGTTIESSGQVSGSLVVSGITCDFLGGANNATGVSISGTVEGIQYTIDINAPDTEPIGVVSLKGGQPYSAWDNRLTGEQGPRPDSGSVTTTGQTGQLSVDLTPSAVDAGDAATGVRLEGSWTCP
jgi:hypothetical protein